MDILNTKARKKVLATVGEMRRIVKFAQDLTDFTEGYTLAAMDYLGHETISEY